MATRVMLFHAAPLTWAVDVRYVLGSPSVEGWYIRVAYDTGGDKNQLRMEVSL
jgi:hypothetical protein